MKEGSGLPASACPVSGMFRPGARIALGSSADATRVHFREMTATSLPSAICTRKLGLFRQTNVASRARVLRSEVDRTWPPLDPGKSGSFVTRGSLFLSHKSLLQKILGISRLGSIVAAAIMPGPPAFPAGRS